MAATRQEAAAGPSRELVPRPGVALGPPRGARPYRRLLSPVERIWLVADRLEPPFAPALVLEGEGELDLAALSAAVERAAEANPGARVVLRGWLSRSRWVGTGPMPRVERVEGAGWDARSGEEAPFLDRPLDPRRGPVLEVLLVPGSVTRLVFRVHHAVMDGRGLFHFVEDVFRALRGEALEGSSSEQTDLELARRLAPDPAARRREDCLAPTGARRGGDTKSVWRRVSIPGTFSRALPRVLCCVARHARSFGTGEVRIGVPVDLRGRTDAERSTANLTGILDLDLPAQATVASVQAALEQALAQHRAAAFVLEAEFIRGVPLWLATAVARASTRRVCRNDRYESSGTVSNLGRVPVERFAGGGFATRAAFFVPPGTASHACFIVLCGHPEGLEAVVTMPGDLASEGRLDELLDALGAALAPAPADG